MADHRLRNFLYRWRVRSGTLLLAAVLLLARPSWKPLIAGFVLSLGGLSLRAWAAGHLRKEKELTVSGPYGYSRNPLYLGNIIMGAGVAAGSWSWGVLAILIVYFLLFYPLVVREEKQRMKTLFPDGYKTYEKNVPLFFPALKSCRNAHDHPFNWALYRKNKEFRALIGLGAVWGLMIAKMYFIH